MKDEVKEPWASAMIAAGHVYAKRPSMRALARAAGIPSQETVRAVIYGRSEPTVETVEAIASALHKPAPVVREWIGQARGASREWVAPAEIALLTDDEQKAITDLIRAIARPRHRRLVVVADIDGAKPAKPARRLPAAARTQSGPPRGRSARDELDRQAEQPDD